MSDVSEGEGWWLASDGKWYPPPAPANPAVPTAGGPPGYGAPFQYGNPPGYGPPGYGPPGYGPPGYGPPGYGPPGYGPPGYGPPGYGPPYGPPGGGPGRTNTLAVLSLVFAIVFWPVGIVLGHIARSQIRRTGEGGNGLALAGLIVGYVLFGLVILAIVIPTFLGVKTGEQNRATESDLINAIVSGKTTYINNGTYGSTNALAANTLGQSEPELNFSTQPVSYNNNAHDISVEISRDGQILVLAEQAQDGSCWYAEDNEESQQGNDGLAYASSTQGISYGSSNGASQDVCSATDQVSNWGGSFPTN